MTSYRLLGLKFSIGLDPSKLPQLTDELSRMKRTVIEDNIRFIGSKLHFSSVQSDEMFYHPTIHL